METHIDHKPIAPNGSSAGAVPQRTTNVYNSMNGPVDLGRGEMRPRPNNLDLPSNSVNSKKKGAQSTSEKSALGCFLLPQLVGKLENSDIKAEAGNYTASQCDQAVHREEAVPSNSCAAEAQKGDTNVCKDCCKSFSSMENKLDNLSTRLEKLETKLSSDVKAIFELLRTHNENVRQRQRDYHTQV